MGGSGIGSYVPSQSVRFDCNIGIINTAVSSIDLYVLDNHKTGDALKIELTNRETVTLVNGNGEVLGSIVHPNTTELIKCIQSGYDYQATITSLTTPTCRVRIERS